MIYKIRRFSKYDNNDKSFDSRIKLIEGEEELSDGTKVPTYRWSLTNDYEIEEPIQDSKRYKDEKSKGGIDKSRIGKLRAEIKKGYLFDSPPGDPLKSRTHCLGTQSSPKSVLKIKRKITCTKDINTSDRLNYSVKYPYYDEEKENIFFLL